LNHHQDTSEKDLGGIPRKRKHMARPGSAWLGRARRGKARQCKGRQKHLREGLWRHSSKEETQGSARPGRARQGLARLCNARVVGSTSEKDSNDIAQKWAKTPGPARHGTAWLGTAMQGPSEAPQRRTLAAFLERG